MRRAGSRREGKQLLESIITADATRSRRNVLRKNGIDGFSKKDA
jgi:hypothetical protein